MEDLEPGALALAVDEYERLVRLLEDDEYYDVPVQLILIARDDIDEGWGRLDAAQRQRVEVVDMLLVQKHNIVAQMLPHPKHSDRRAWWWFLHEGPQVREKAREAA
ncbi:MAG: hypothetical protein HY675_12145 [Chloroflexi bacterium]|nr:hypothetical protein [Chloroflexota bacterium]